MENQNIINLILISFCNIFAGLSLCLLTPFYPTEALSKGVSVTQTGLVFGSVFITTVIITPLCGKYHHAVSGGARTFLLLGSFICALGNICSGFLDWVNSSSLFLSLSFLLRIITAIGEGAISSSVYTLSAQQSTKENEGKLISLAEACYGMGTMFGPTVGGFLYEVGGFSAPFWTCGGILLVISLAIVFFLQESQFHGYDSMDKQDRVGWCTLLQIPEIPISMLSLALAGSSWSWYSASLAPFLSVEHGLSASQCGLVFMLFGLCYTLFTPFFGFLLDRGLGGLITLIIGNLLITVGFIFVGPIPQLEVISGNLWLTGLSIGLHGIGCASTYVGSLIYMLKSVTASGLPDSEQIQVMVSSLWMVADCMGAYVGSSLGGLAYDKFGFQTSTLMECIVMAISVALPLILVVRSWYCSKYVTNNNMLPK